MEEANLDGANFEGANLEETDFKKANLEEAYLEGADFEVANLKGVNGLTINQLSKVKTLHNIKLYEKLLIPLRENYPALFEKPKLQVLKDQLFYDFGFHIG